MRFNLSEWALKHRSLVDLLHDRRGGCRCLVLSSARPQRGPDLHHQDDGGAGSMAGSHRRRHPEAGHRAARAQTAGDAEARLPAQLYDRRRHDDLRQSEGQRHCQEGADIWYHVRKSIGDIRHTLPAGIVGPGFNDEFGDTFGIIYGFTADGFTHRELRDYVEDVRSKLLQVPDVSKIEMLGAQDERIFVEFSMKELANLGIDRSASDCALQAQNIVRPAGTIQTGDETLSLRVSGAFRSEQDVLGRQLVVGGRMHPARRYRQGAPRLCRSAAAACFASTASRRSGSPSRCARAATSWRSGKNVKQAMNRITADLPIGIEPMLVADQPVTVDERDRRLHHLAVAGDRHHPRGQLHQPRRPAGRGGGARDSGDARDRVPGHADAGGSTCTASRSAR